jgi:hypothetical protein
VVKILSFNEYLFESSAQKDQSVIDSFKAAIKSQQAEELPRGSNKGPEVEVLQKGVGVNPGAPWCAAFVHGILSKTSFSPEIKSKIPKDAAVKNHWENSKAKKVNYKPGMGMDSILPGMVFCYLSKDKKTGGYPGHGHTGIILSVDKEKKEWTGIEGNANPLDGSREGYGTFIVTRKLDDPSISQDIKDHPAKLLGFVDYFYPYRSNPEFTGSLTDTLNGLVSELLPKTNKEISYLKSNPEVLKDYEKNYNDRNKYK